MGKYSLINVSSRKNGLVSGVWIQDSTGSIDEALQKARDTERANSNRIEVAVVESILVGSPNYSLKADLEEIK